MTVNFQVVNIISASVSRIKFVLSKLTVKYPQMKIKVHTPVDKWKLLVFIVHMHHPLP